MLNRFSGSWTDHCRYSHVPEFIFKGFVVTIALLPAMVQMVILLVNGNLGTGVAVMGAFSLVRFRSVPGKAEEISSIFQAMAVGLATGMGYVGMAVLFVLIMGGVNILLASLKFGQQKTGVKVLKITIPESLDYTSVFDEVFARYLKNWDLNQVKTTNMGSLYKLDYEVVLKNNGEEKKLIDDLRCRNGNLEIFLEDLLAIRRSYNDKKKAVQRQSSRTGVNHDAGVNNHFWL